MKFLTISLMAIATLFNISAFAACPNGNVTLSTQTEVDNFSTTYPGCTTLPSNVKLKIEDDNDGVDNITNLDGLSVLTTVNGQLEFKNCDNLTDIDGLMSLTTVNGELQFDECHALTNLDALSNLTTCNDLEIKGMDALTSISGLSGLTALSGELNIKDCDALVSLAGLDNLTSIGRSLRIDGNAKLTDISALSNLTSVGISVYVLNNANLPNLDGLDNITYVGKDLDIYDNPLLEDCIGACRMIDAVAPPGMVDIRDNKPGTHCSDITTLEADCLIALPVELSDFRAKEDKKNATVVLSWTTASELNNKHFEVERSADGRNFTTVGIVAGNGTTTKAYNYKFVDAQPIATAYYRLKQVDFAGDFAYSDLVLVEMTKATAAEVAAYPTVAKNEITLRFKGFEAQSGTFNVFNSQGRLVYSEQVDLSNKMAYKTLNIAKLDNGIYTIVISDNSKNITTNFVVVK